MKFAAEIVIDRPRERVIALMADSTHTAQWQPGIQSITPLSADRDAVGARSRVILAMHGIRLEMIETVVRRNPPDEFVSRFEARGVTNLVTNRFYEEAPGRTRWVMENAFEFNGLMAIARPFMRDVVAKQTVESMQRFKIFAEGT
jgi:uncharacterized protein YndB with AHSA1/START domain